MGWARSPALHFLAIGAVAFGISRFSSAAFPAFGGADDEPFEISGARVESLRSSWLTSHGVPPSRWELAALLEADVEQELLVREARRLGFDRTDPIVRRRLARNVAFASDREVGSADESRLVEEAFELGLERTDLVVRRRLVQRMKLRVFTAARQPDPTPAELTAYLGAHPERYAKPARVRLSHVFSSRDRRGEALERVAAAQLAQVRAGSLAPDDAVALGDAFLHGAHLPLHSERELAQKFGQQFARQVIALPASEGAGGWYGPIESSFGLHLVWVHERTEAAPADLDAVATQVREALLRDRGEAALREHLAQLAARHPIEVVGTGADVLAAAR